MGNNELWIEVVFGERPERPVAILVRRTEMFSQLGGSGFKVLQALALHALMLAHPRLPGGEEEFQHLLELGLVTDEDRGRLAASVSHGQVARETGLSRHTVGKCLRRLEALGVLRHHSLWGVRARGRIWGCLVVFDRVRVREAPRGEQQA